MATAEQKAETHGFQAEVQQILDLMIHSLYSNKEIFLRELISNASDAADKLRFEVLSNAELYENDSDLKVWVEFNESARTVTIRDNGIGMTKEEVIANIGTIAKSGTKEFMSKLTGDRVKDSQLIGQFGVGFYSAFIVADQVTLYTRKAGESEDNGVKWVSKGDGKFDISTTRKSQRGTEIILHLKPDEDEFLSNYRLRSIITKYSDHIDLPIVMHKEKAPETEEEKDKKDENIIDVPEEEVVNRATALWTRPKQEVTEEQYKELYKHVGHDFDDPLAWSHNKVEGKHEYTTLLYVPKRAPFDLFQANKPRGLKLYVQRVFIMDDAENFLPHYLRFVRGIIDSNDLPLNISREILQGNKVVDSMRSAVIKRILSVLEDMAKNKPEDYQTFWGEFGQVMKEGPAEDFTNKERVAKLLRFSSTHIDKPEQTISLEQYVSRMQEKQEKIFYVAADTFNAAKSSPHLEVFRKKGIEVLLLTDKVDEWLMAHLTEFDGKQIQSIARGDLDLAELEDKEAKKEHEKLSKEHKGLVEKVKEALGEQVKEVRVSKRLTSSPACIVVDANDMTPQMERLMKAAGQPVPTTKPILELNPTHPMVEKLEGQEGDKFKDWTQILLDQAVLAEGGQLNDPAAFVHRFNNLLLELSQ